MTTQARRLDYGVQLGTRTVVGLAPSPVFSLTGRPRPVFCKRGRLQDCASRGRLAHYGAGVELRPRAGPQRPVQMERNSVAPMLCDFNAAPVSDTVAPIAVSFAMIGIGT